MATFTHLHVHTEYSLLDGTARIKDLVLKAKTLGMDSLAITDHGVMYGVVDFYKACKKHNIKPILGCEVYVSKRSRKDRVPNIDDTFYHLVLLAKNSKGYKNLMKLCSLGFTEGFYYKPRIDVELLEKYSKGLISLSGCMAGKIPTLLLEGNYEEAKSTALRYNEIFGQGNFYLELQDHGIHEQKVVNQQLIRLHNETGIPLVATNDVHYLNKQDNQAHDILLCIQTGKTVDDEDRLKFPTQEFYLKSQKEMEQLFSYIPEALENTERIARMCDIELDFGNLHLPQYTLESGYDENTYLEKLCWEGAQKRYNKITSKIENRLKYELQIIKQMGFSSYFLIVWDFVKYAREKGIMVGPGRGSAAGSLVAYCLFITNIDPLKHNLLFERFLNPDRVSMPDIDIDFCYERRQEVIDYVTRHYGSERVAQIITFGTMAARAVIRDVGRALNMSYAEVDAIAKMIPFEPGMTIDRALQINPDLKKRYEQDERIQKLIDTSRALEGLPRHASTHAAGVVISKEPLTEYVPLQKTSDGIITTQFSMTLLEELGLLKMDFLGLRTLTVIRDTLEIVKHTRGLEIDINSVALDIPEVYHLLAKGDTIGVFQLESSGMQNLLRELKPSVFEDIVAVVGLYRPGPLGSGAAEDFILSKHGKKPIKYLHPKLEPILKETYGVILYQEQAMRIAQELAGFSLAQADILRKAMGKKKQDVMETQRQSFIKGCEENGIDRKIAVEIFDMIAYFAGYGFNKAHSAAYALIAYQTAYLKVHYPAEFMAALLTSVMDNSDKVAIYIKECRRLGIKVLPPDINESLENFTVVDRNIRFGLAAVKNVGRNAVRSIISARKSGGNFVSLTDFLERVDLGEVNKKAVESLIKGGAFDSLGVFRSQLLAVYENVCDSISSSMKHNLNGQISLFSFMSEKEKNDIKKDDLPDIPEFTQKELLAMEKEMLGLYISGHPLEEYSKQLKNLTTISTSVLTSQNSTSFDNKPCIIGGIIIDFTTKTTKNNNLMAFLTLEDMEGLVEVLVFPNVFEKFRDLIKKDNIVLVKGRISLKEEEEGKIICDEIMPFESKTKKELYLRLLKDHDSKTLEYIKETVLQHQGKIPIYFWLSGEEKVVEAESSLWVNGSDELIEQLSKIIGWNNIVLLEG
ncbi:MAG: polymerase subunit alpha [Thermosediminibacterales bacterium]|nr:polymerase subunit alpha [Thermosediminibacterales bacterium]MDK2835242.1 polymerase subunit alpha [Thermosediminibacterales bacterium]